MSSARRRWLAAPATATSIGLLLAATAVSSWLLLDDRPGPRRAEVADDNTPDLILEGFEATTLDEDGQPRRRVSAAEMVHFPQTGTHELTEPRMVILTRNEDPWHISSRRGWLSEGGDVMLLMGDVNIWRNAADGTRRLDIRTSDLRVLPASEFGETDKPVTITTPHSQSRSVGARAFLAQGRVEMLSNVKTVYKRDGFDN